MKTISITVHRREAGLSLVEFLASRLNTSKKKAKQTLNTRQVFVNRRRVWMAQHVLRENDVIETFPSSGFAAKTERMVRLFEDGDLLIVDKRAGIPSTGLDSVETRIKAQLEQPSLKAAHRLDKDTSGCLVFAGNDGVYEEMIALFRKRLVKKTYRAIVRGRVKPSIHSITTPVDSQRALTHIEILAANKEASHLRARIKTGRTHQIRKHLVSIGHPVIGDRYYGARALATDKTLRIGRQMLHAYKLEFEHPRTGQPIIVKSPLPRDFRRCLKLFRLS